jgi:hypothetical protein
MTPEPVRLLWPRGTATPPPPNSGALRGVAFLKDRGFG